MEVITKYVKMHGMKPLTSSSAYKEGSASND